jgi:hypothetical protein
MNGYEYLVQRHRLMVKLEAQLARLGDLPEAERRAETSRLQARFDIELAELYAKVVDEYPGERKKRARPLADPR